MAEKTRFEVGVADALDDNQLVMEKLAGDWTMGQQMGRVSIQNTLRNYSYEVDGYLSYNFNLSGPGLMRSGFDSLMELPPDDPVSLYYFATRRAEANKLRAAAEVKDPHLAEVATHLRLASSVRKHSGKDSAERSVDAIYSLDVDDDTKRALHAGQDFWTYREAKNSRIFAKSFIIPNFASTEAARSAMLGALDLRVLTYALRDKSPQRDLAQETISQFASSDIARTSMLNYVETLKEGRRTHSTGYYQPRITREFLAHIHLERLMRETQRIREESARRRSTFEEEMRQHEEWFRKFKEQNSDLFDNTRRPKTNSAEEADTEARLQSIISSAHYSVRGTLRRMDRSVLTDILFQTDELRKSEPEITDRKIIAHFHYRGQLEDAPKEDIETAKAIHLLAKTDTGVASALCF